MTVGAVPTEPRGSASRQWLYLGQSRGWCLSGCVGRAPRQVRGRVIVAVLKSRAARREFILFFLVLGNGL